MKIDLSVFRQSFLEEATEHIATLEQGLLVLESKPNESEALHAIFRAAHSIKGAAGSLGFGNIADFTHALETLLDRMRQGNLSASTERISLLLKSVDALRELLRAIDSDEPMSVGITNLLQSLKLTSEPSPIIVASAAVAPEASKSHRRVRVTLAPAPEFFVTGLDPLLLFRDLASLGSLEGVAADLARLPTLEGMDPEKCYLSFTSILITDVPDHKILDVFVFVEDVCRVTLTEDEDAPVERRAATRDLTNIADHSVQHTTSSTLRVSTDKVDALIDLVGEIVIAQSMVKQLMNTLTSSQLATLQDAMSALENNTQDLQARVMAIRMVPMSAVFGRFPRIVRDLAGTMGKDVALSIEGEDTELDKGMVERLSDPLTHLVRNALDHGLETAAERASQGKTGQGNLRLSAQHAAGGIVIELSDDGRGLDTQRIRCKAETLGLIRATDVVSDEQIQALIFEPGFSTAETVSDLSGRGVGMDVVKRTIDALNGSIAVATQPGHGTAFRIKLPLTLAILDGLTLGVASQRFIVPLLAVTESLRPSANDYKHVLGRGELIVVRGQALPLLRLHELFGIAGAEEDPTRALVVVVEADGNRVGLVVDSLLGQAQVVLKSLEAHYRRIDGVMGATILGDGQVSLILDIPGLVRTARLTNPQNKADAA